jgi:hypothetical protein
MKKRLRIAFLELNIFNVNNSQNLLLKRNVFNKNNFYQIK